MPPQYYREVQKLAEFLSVYEHFINASERGDQQSAWQAQQVLARQSRTVQDLLDRVDCGQYWLIDAPVAGGRRQRASLTGLLVSNDLVERYNIRPNDVILQIQAGIGAYESGQVPGQEGLRQAILSVSLAPLRLIQGLWTLFGPAGRIASAVVAVLAGLKTLGWLPFLG